jgi:HTH-type transcriptional regulator, global nitrogen regulator NrpRI
MFTYEEIDRKSMIILRILNQAGQPLGARIIARRMKDYGIALSERAVRYHLQFMDEKKLTDLVGRRDGRVITATGIEELRNARVQEKVGYAISRIEILSYKTTFDVRALSGLVPVNVSFFPVKTFPDALAAMKGTFQEGLCISDLVSVAGAGSFMGDVHVPEGHVGLATLCSIVFNGVLLKQGIPMDSKFGGILQLQEKRPIRFVELIHYSGTSLDPSEAFISAKMTTVRDAVARGEGKILANFREVAGICRESVMGIMDDLARAGIRGVLSIGKMSEPVCQVPVDVNKVGMITLGGLNPVAAARELGIEAENLAMSTVMDYRELKPFGKVLRQELRQG